MKTITNFNRYFLFLLIIIIVLEAFFFNLYILKINLIIKKQEDSIEKLKNTLDSLLIESKAVSVFDGTEYKKIYGKNDEIQMPIASLTKIMTVVTALNVHNDDGVISISLEALRQNSDYGFFINEKFNIEDLAKFTLVGSVNDGAFALVGGDNNFLDKMNLKAKKIGMEKTLFLNFTGLDFNTGLAGAYASAKDVNIMAVYAFKAYSEVFNASIIPEISIKSLSGFEHSIKNTNIILDKIPNVLLSKTGYTPLAGGNLAIVFKDKRGHEIAVTVLGSTYTGRFSDMEKIVKELYNFNYGN